MTKGGPGVRCSKNASLTRRASASSSPPHDSNPGGLQALPPPSTCGRLANGVTHLRDAGDDDRLGTGRRTPVVVTRLQRHVHRPARAEFAGRLQRDDLRMPPRRRLRHALAGGLAERAMMTAPTARLGEVYPQRPWPGPGRAACRGGNPLRLRSPPGSPGEAGLGGSGDRQGSPARAGLGGSGDRAGMAETLSQPGRRRLEVGGGTRRVACCVLRAACCLLPRCLVALSCILFRRANIGKEAPMASSETGAGVMRDDPRAPSEVRGVLPLVERGRARAAGAGQLVGREGLREPPGER